MASVSTSAVRQTDIRRSEAWLPRIQQNVEPEAKTMNANPYGEDLVPLQLFPHPLWQFNTLDLSVAGAATNRTKCRRVEHAKLG